MQISAVLGCWKTQDCKGGSSLQNRCATVGLRRRAWGRASGARVPGCRPEPQYSGKGGGAIGLPCRLPPGGPWSGEGPGRRVGDRHRPGGERGAHATPRGAGARGPGGPCDIPGQILHEAARCAGGGVRGGPRTPRFYYKLRKLSLLNYLHALFDKN